MLGPGGPVIGDTFGGYAYVEDAVVTILSVADAVVTTATANDV